MKKLLSIIMAIVICLGVLAIGVSAVDVADKTLKFSADGTFKIMQVADLQDSPFAAPATTEYLESLIKSEKPDLIVLTGDNISGRSTESPSKAVGMSFAKTAIDSFMSMFEKHQVPVAVVFGNHDAEGSATKEEMMNIYQSYKCCIGIDEGSEIYGCGTYNLPIYSSDKEKVAYNLYMFDSNMYDEVNGGYDHIDETQIDWYIKTSNELKAQNGGVPVPSMAFQHIIVNEIYDALKVVDEGTEGAIERNKKYYVLPEGAKGELNEAPCPGTVDSQQFEAMAAQGDVKAMFFGHDHVNTFEVNYNGIDIVNSPASGYGAYGSKETRGVRMITLNEKDTSKYETEVITYLDRFGKDNFSICRILMNEIDGDAAVVWNAIRYLFLAPSNGVSPFKALYEVFCLIA